MRTHVRKIGNSLGSIIPASLIRQLNLQEGSEINVNVIDGKIVIESAEPQKTKLPFCEDDLLKGLNAYLVHADELAEISAEDLGE